MPAASTISVVMATYQGERYLPEQLESLANQTRLPDELVVSDDCSTDATWKILADFVRRAPFAVKLHQNASRVGWVENFFVAVRAAEGSLIAFADQDDVWLAHKLERMSARLADPGVQLALCHSAATDEALNVNRRRFRSGVVSRALLAGPLLSPPGNCMVGRRELVDLLPTNDRPPPFSGETQAHDEWLFFAAQCFGRVAAVRQTLVLYRRHAATVTSSNEDAPRRAWLTVPDARELSFRIDVCRGRAAYLQRLLNPAERRVRADLEAPLRRQQRRYERLAMALAHRKAIIESKRPACSVYRLARAAARRTYGPQRVGGTGWLALVQDVLWLFRWP